MLSITSASGADCELHPIAISAGSLQGVSVGDDLPDLLNGTQPGNFGWLTWAGSPSESTLVGSLMPPGDSRTFINPGDPDDRVVSTGDWVQGKPGVSNSRNVRDALDALKTREIIVPVWSESRGQGEKTAYRVSAFARVRLMDYELPGRNRITARFLGYTACGNQNQPPRVEAGPDQTIHLPDSAALTGIVSDDGLPEAGALTVTWSVVDGPGVVSFADSAAAMTTARFGAEGIYQLRLIAGDGELTASDDLVVTVNHPNNPPVAESLAFATDEDTPVSAVLRGTDPEGSALSFVIETEPSYGVLTGTPPNVTYTPKSDYNGPDGFTFKAFDGGLYSAAAAVAIAIRPINDRPVADPLTTSTPEDTSLSVMLSGSDVEGSAPTYSIVAEPAHGSLAPDDAPSGRFTYMPEADYHGADSFVFIVNDGELDSTPATVSLTIVPVNDPPFAAAGEDVTVRLTEGVTLSGNVADDSPALTVTWGKASGPGAVVFADVDASETTATFSIAGTYVLRLTASDGEYTTSDDIAVEVYSDNQPPAVDAGPDQTLVLSPPVPSTPAVSSFSIPRGNRDSRGTNFRLAFPGNWTHFTPSGTFPPVLTLVVTAETDAAGTVAIPGLNFSTNFAVSAGSAAMVTIPQAAELFPFGKVEEKGIHVTATDDVTVYGLSNSDVISDAFLVLPTDALGTNHIVLAYPQSGTQFAIVGTEDDTIVTLNLSEDITYYPDSIPNFQSGAPVHQFAGIPFTIALHQGQTFHLRHSGGAAVDFTGTTIQSDKPVAVFGGHLCAEVPMGYGGCNYLVEQLPPVSSWGRRFVAMPLALRTGGDIIRFLAAADGTHVGVDGAPVATLDRGQVHEQFVAGPIHITADQPILVAQYAVGANYDQASLGDPFMVLVPPLEQFLNRYAVATTETSYPANGFATNYVNILAPMAAVGGIELDGVSIPADGFLPIGSSGFSGAQIPLARGSHQLSGPAAFGAMVYGYDRFDGYGYTGGLALGSIASVANVSVSPSIQTNRVATGQCVTVAVTDTARQPLAGVRVDFEVTGANPVTGLAFTEGNGLARFCYVGSSVGTDVIIARTGGFTASGTNVWTPPPAITLNGVAGDDGLPPGGALALSWTQVSGPGTVVFDEPDSAVTGVSFSGPGTYVLRLKASDSELVASDQVTITVRSNTAPLVNAGTDQVVVSPGAAVLEAMASDDGIPGPLALYWNQVSGPALARIHDTTALTTVVSFDTAGVYIFRCTTSDSLLSASDEVLVTVQQPPTVCVTAPSSGALFQEGDNIPLAARANDNDGSIAFVEFFADALKVAGTTTRLSSAPASPYGAVWTNTFPGTHSLSAVATDTQGLSAMSAPVNVIVNAKPQVRFTNATNVLFEVVPSDLTLTVEATDPDGTVTNVVLYEVFVSPEGFESPFIVDQSSAAPFTFVRPFTFPGDKKFQARAYDDRGGVGLGEITLRIRALPQVQILFLTDGSFQAAGRPLELFAEATEYDGELSRVEFFADTTGLGEAILHPIFGFWWHLNWTNPPVGDFALTAVATDSEGNSGFSQPVLLHFRHPPAIQFTSPANQTASDYGQTLLLSAAARDPDGAVALVEFYADGQRIGAATGASNFTFVWTNAPVGTFSLAARAIDDTGLSTTTEPIEVTVRPVPTAPPVVAIIRPTNNAVVYRGASIRFDAGFDDPDGYVAKVEFYANTEKLHEVVYPISPAPYPAGDGFTWFNPPLGNHTLRVVATDSSGIISTSAPVNISVVPAPPVVQITNPRDGQRFLIGGLPGLQGFTSDPDGVVTNLQFFQNGLSIGSMRPFSSSFFLALPTLPKGHYTFAVAAADDSGLSTTSAPVRVRIDNYNGPPSISLSLTNEDRVITAPTPIFGTVTNLFPNSYELSYRLKTPDRSAAWTPFATGADDVVDGPLGVFDPTLLLNGIYEIQVSASDPFSGTTTAAVTTVVVEGNMKIGHFTLSFNDLSVPMAGLPIQIVRTYDSRDKRVGDFGVGWTLDLKNVRIQKNRSLSKDWIETTTGGDFPTYCLDPVKPRLVTITFPGGKVHRFQFDPDPACQFLVPITSPRWRFTPLPGTHGTLEPAGIEEPDGGFLTVNGSIPGTVDVFDLNFFTDAFGNPAITTDQLYAYPDRFRFTTPEGYRYLISETNGLQSVTDPNGNSLTITTNGLFHSAGKNVSFHRDPLGRITNIIDAAGASMRYLYDTRGDLIAFVDREGQTNAYAYNGTHHLLTLTDARGITPARNEYDDAGRLVRHIDPFGREILYAHDLTNRIEITTDRLGHQTIQEYDERGNIVRTIDPLGGETRATYDANDKRLTQTNPLGETTTYLYDAVTELLTAIVDPLGHTNHFAYNGGAKLLGSTDANGRTVHARYDGRNNVTNVVDAFGHVSEYRYDALGRRVYARDPLGNEIHSEYDAFGNLTRTTNALGHVTGFGYDEQNRLISQITSRTTSAGTEWLTNRWAYDRNGRVIEAIAPDGSSIKTIYNAFGEKAASIDELGRQTSYGYDELGRLTRTIFPDGASESSGYDANGRRVAVTNRLGQVTRFEYDPLGRLTRTLFADGSATTNYHDLAGRLAAASDARGNTTFFGYDAAGRQTSVTNSLGQVTRYAYDPRGNLISTTDPLGRTTAYAYDDANHRTHVLYADGSFQFTAYDALGRRVFETDQSTNMTWFGYDALGRLTSVTNALGHVTRYEYDELGQQTAQIDANNHTTRYEHDNRGRRTRRILPLGMADSSTYDAVGNMLTHTDFNGHTTSYQYDDLNRLIQKTPDPRLGEPPITFACNALGLRTNMVDAGGVTAYRYDDRNRLIEKSVWFRLPDGSLVPEPSTLSYASDANGNVTNIQSSNVNGAAVAYEYDALNRLSAVNDAKLGRTTCTYDGAGNLRGFTHPNSVNTFYEYDSLNRLTNVSAGRLLTQHANFAYTLDASGHRLTATETITLSAQPLVAPEPGGGGSTINRSYAYDALYRLTSESLSSAEVSPALNGSVAYTYDAVGNRLARNSSLPGVLAANYGYDANDRLLTDTYDDNGNTRAAPTRNPELGTQNLVADRYDFENRLIERETTINSQPLVAPEPGGGGSTINLSYDADGNRIRKTVTTSSGTATVFYLVEDRNPTGYPQVLEELTLLPVASGLSPELAVTRVYTYGHALLSQDQVIEPVATGEELRWQESFYGYDGQDSVRYLTDRGGNVTDTYAYDAFGNLIARSSIFQTPTPNLYLYQGEQFDPDLGLYYLRARYADPDRGRFWTMDSFEGFGTDPASLHKYTFNHNDPVNRRDPDGHISLTETMHVNALAPSVRAQVQQLLGSFTTCWFKTALYRGAIGEGIGATLGGAVSSLIQYFTQGDVDGGQLFMDALEGAREGFLDGFMSANPFTLVTWSTYTTTMGFESMVQTIMDPNAPTWIKVMQTTAFVTTALPVVSPRLARLLSEKLTRIFCFPAGTEISTIDGQKPIEQIGVGDLVWSQNDMTGERSLKRVRRLFTSVASVLVALHLGTNVVEATPSHPFWVADQGWKAAAQIQPGDELFTRSAARVPVTGIAHRQGQFPVFNFEVEGTHTYFVGAQELLAHNACWAGPSSARYVYDVTSGRYRETKTGRFVSQRDLPYPPNNGFASSSRGTVQPGTVIDRYGRPSGRYAGEPGASVSERGLPPGSEGLEYHRYEVIKPIDAEIGPAAAVSDFGASGGTTQYFLDLPVKELVRQGFLKEL